MQRTQLRIQVQQSTDTVTYIYIGNVSRCLSVCLNRTDLVVVVVVQVHVRRYLRVSTGRALR